MFDLPTHENCIKLVLFQEQIKQMRHACFPLSLGHLFLLLLGHLHGDLFFLDEKSTNDATADTLGAFAATVSTGDGLPAMRQTGQLAWTSVGHATKLQLAIAALGNRTILFGVEIHKTTTGRFDARG